MAITKGNKKQHGPQKPDLMAFARAVEEHGVDVDLAAQAYCEAEADWRQAGGREPELPTAPGDIVQDRTKALASKRAEGDATPGPLAGAMARLAVAIRASHFKGA